MKQVILMLFIIFSLSLQSQAQIEGAFKPLGYFKQQHSHTIGLNITKRISINYTKNQTLKSNDLNDVENSENQVGIRYFFKSNESGLFSAIHYGKQTNRTYIYDVAGTGGGILNLYAGTWQSGGLTAFSYDRVVNRTYLGLETGYRWKLSKLFFFDSSIGLRNPLKTDITAENVNGNGWDGSIEPYSSTLININFNLGMRIPFIKKGKYEFF